MQTPATQEKRHKYLGKPDGLPITLDDEEQPGDTGESPRSNRTSEKGTRTRKAVHGMDIPTFDIDEQFPVQEPQIEVQESEHIRHRVSKGGEVSSVHRKNKFHKRFQFNSPPTEFPRSMGTGGKVYGRFMEWGPKRMPIRPNAYDDHWYPAGVTQTFTGGWLGRRSGCRPTIADYSKFARKTPKREEVKTNWDVIQGITDEPRRKKIKRTKGSAIDTRNTNSSEEAPNDSS